jgi:hypothetical protein
MVARLFLVFAVAFVISGGAAMAIEEPAYQASLQEGAFEVRDYPALMAAEVTITGDRNAAGNAGFRALFGYITGGNTRRQSIAMTAPVVQAATGGEKIAMTVPVTQSGDGSGWTIRFMMPSGSTPDSLPTPEDSRVHLVALPPSRFAVVRFAGLAREAQVEEETAGLNRYIAGHHLRPIGPPALARYNPPWTLWFLRRNEVWIPVEAEAKPASSPPQ